MLVLFLLKNHLTLESQFLVHDFDSRPEDEVDDEQEEGKDVITLVNQSLTH